MHACDCAEFPCTDQSSVGLVASDRFFFLVFLNLFYNVSVSKHSCIHAQTFRQVPSVTDIRLKPRQVKNVAVIGGGLMGSGIATAFILGGINVILKELNSEYLQKGLKRIEGKELQFTTWLSVGFLLKLYL